MGRWDLENTMELSTGSMVNKKRIKRIKVLSIDPNIFQKFHRICHGKIFLIEDIGIEFIFIIWNKISIIYYQI